ncbi:MAG: hypothetical protein RIS29_2121 [Bacteroidota bacterium]|jgi:YVTN family beta-propeller protein
MNHFFRYLSILIWGITAYSCDDMKDIASPQTLSESLDDKGQLYVLSEGLFNMNNSTLTLLDFDAHRLNTDFFQTTNERKLGDTANDMKRYGSMLWIAVNVSSDIEVLDAKTGLSIKRIPMYNASATARQPRFISFWKDKAYVCSFDGTVSRIDTATLTIDATIKVGRNPDGIVAANNKLYVSNSGGLDYPNYDHTISVVDIESFTETSKIEVGLNPYKLQADSEGDIYAIVRGNNGSIKPRFVRIDSQTDQLVENFDSIQAMNFCIQNDTAYLYNYDNTKGTYWIKIFDCKKEQIINRQFVADATSLKLPFGIYVHPSNGNVYIADAKDYVSKGDLYCFSRNGKLKYKIAGVGLNPNTIIVR